MRKIYEENMAVSLKIVERQSMTLDLLSPDARTRARIQWLGQAGFLIDTLSARIIIDPYLSNSLGVKYRGARFSHVRMMPVPIDPHDIHSVCVYCATHHHGDHLDADTLAAIASKNPECIFVVPAAIRENAKLRAAASEKVFGADAFASMKLDSVQIYPIPSAHEELTIDEAGHHVFLGYVISVDGLTIYHSGDCTPYEGLEKNLAPFKIDLALVPVNGRDEERRDAGILGNFSLEEAVQLSRNAGFVHTIGHHFGMFDFNTIDVAEAVRKLKAENITNFQVARMNCVYELE